MYNQTHSDKQHFKKLFLLDSIVVLSLRALLHSLTFSNIFFIVLNISLHLTHIYMLILLTFYVLENDRKSVETSFFIRDFYR